MKRVLGIDLGTSNCCVAVFENGRPKVIPDERGNSCTPSYLTLLPNGKYLVGHLAKVQAISNPFQTAFAVKRLMGQRIDDPAVSRFKEMVGFAVVEGSERGACVKLGEKILSPVEISAIYLKSMRDIACAYFEDDSIRDAVITVPAYFNDGQRKATKEAGEKAGLNVLRLINEPTSAALAYGFKRNMNKRLAIFDLGGGTFDVSILHVNGGVFEVVGTGGDTFLGGEDFDERIVNLVIEDFQAKHGINLRGDKMALQRVKDACENAKCELSTAERAQVNLPFIASGKEGSLNLAYDITRADFQQKVEDLIQRAIELCGKVLQDCRLKKEQIDEVVLVGGQTRMPAVQKAIAQFFGKPPVKGVHPDEAVALGAAIEGNVLETHSQDVLLLDVTPLSLGIESRGDMFAKIVEKNSKVPISVSKIFTTTQDEQTRVKINVLQGEGRKASENVVLGEFILEGIRVAPRMEPKIQVSFRIDSDGILNVKAVDLDTQQMQQISFRNYISKSSDAAGLGKTPVASAPAGQLIGDGDASLEIALRD